MVDVVCMGELLIDFVSTENGCSLVDAPSFKKAPGGAPANVAVGLAHLGLSSAFIGKVGSDDFGQFLAQALKSNGVNVDSLCFSETARTALAFVSLTASGEREFMFYRHPSADMLYETAEVDDALIRQAKVFHYGSISLISEPSRTATLHAIRMAQSAGLLTSYDPNLRLPLWSGQEHAREGLLRGWNQANVIKASEEELEFLSGKDNLPSAARSLWHPGLKLLVVTLGDKGCHYFTEQGDGYLPGFAVHAIDTTGAGDGFVAALLARILRHSAIWNDSTALETALIYANAVGALTTTKLGAIPALPSAEDAEHLVETAAPQARAPIEMAS